MGNLKVYGTTDQWTQITKSNRKYYVTGTTVANAVTAASSYGGSSATIAGQLSGGKKVFISYASSVTVGFVTSTSTAIQTYGYIIFASSGSVAGATIVPLTDVTPAIVNGLEGYTFTMPEGCNYVWVGSMANISSYTISSKFSTLVAYRADEVEGWVDASCETIPAAPQLVNTTETRSIQVQGQYSGSAGWTYNYYLSNTFPTSDTLKYLPSSTSQQIVKILTPNTVNAKFIYGTVSGATLTPQGDCTWTQTAVDNKTLYTVTIPANKVCFVTKWFQGSSGASSSNNYYEGFVPDDISVDNDWITGALHKNNGTSWD